MSSSKVDCVTANSEVTIWAPSQAFKVGEIITLSGGGEWAKFGAASVDPDLDETYVSVLASVLRSAGFVGDEAAAASNLLYAVAGTE